MREVILGDMPTDSIRWMSHKDPMATQIPQLLAHHPRVDPCNDDPILGTGWAGWAAMGKPQPLAQALGTVPPCNGLALAPTGKLF